MFSLILNAAKYVLGSSQPAEPNIDELIARLQNAKDEAKDSIAIADADADNNPEGCFYKTGTVTTITEDYVLVDKSYICERINVNVVNLNLGDKVYYMAYQNNKNEEPRIRKIISTVDDNWDDENINTPTDNVIQAQMIKRSIVAKVMRREGRQVFLEPINVSLNLDKVNSTFIPYVGDWLQLDSLVELDENSGDLSGEVLEIDKIQPLRSKLKVGNVTKWDNQNGVGSVDKDIVFNKGSCEPGYVPCIGDKVVTDCIESDQGIYTWRSLTVVPLVQVTQRETIAAPLNNSNANNFNVDVLLKDKHGIVITNDLSFTLNAQEEKDLIVEITNTSNKEQHTLNRGVFMSKKAQSQLSLVSPTVDTVTRLYPSKSISYVFRCRAKFVGTSEELFIFIFKGFKIGRMFRITVNARNSSTYTEPLTRERIMQPVVQADYDQGSYIQGIRPCKPPSFVAVRNGIFRVPQRFWDAVLPSINEGKSQIECELAVSEAIPCLLQGLSPENYTTRFHALLYLEEISLTIDMQRYDMDSAILRPHGEYLGLTVPGLAEKRPSLMIGDRAIVSFNWDDSRGQLKYEGFVHKVKSSEVLLKFNQRFHETYNSEECQVSFKCSYSTIGRSHTAVNLAIVNLGSEILFPTKVLEKEPQINLEEIEPEEKPKIPIRHNRSESLSSVCSNASVTSASDTSSDSLSRNPRISVAERLFQVKSNGDSGKSEKLATSPDNHNKYTKLASLMDSLKREETTPVKNSTNNIQQQVDPRVAQLMKRNLVWYNKKLNYYQKEAVKNILNGVARPLPYVIFGPPGTGKTITLCETALQILTTIPESRLLIATPSNSSANLISERLLDSGVLKPGDLVRLVAHHCLEDDSIPERLLPYCATGNLAAEWSVTGKEWKDYEADKPKANCTMSVLGRHRITVGTCMALGLLYNMGFPRGHFTHIFVDEAGQATEPEIMVPLTFVHSSYGQIVLAGDPMQLGPVVNSKLASHFGFGESFLSRLLHQFPYQRDNEGFEMGYDPRLVTKLVMNYRSLPEILELPNSLFYDSELRPQISATKSTEAELVRSMAEDLPSRNGQPPAIIFHGVNGENRQDPDSPSWYNPAEATQAYLYLLKLYDREISGADIGIITPYQKQVRQIRDLLLELDVELPKVGSVEEFQGQERKVIILSAVRSASNFVNEDIKHALGFVASPRRLNVAITRARALLIILGNPELLSQDPYWRSVLIYCIERGCYTGCNFLSSYLENGIDEILDDENSQ